MQSQGIWKASSQMSWIHVKENSKRIWIMHTSRCTWLYGSNLRMYAVIGLKDVYIIFHMFVGMIKETSKGKKWSIGSNESTAGQGKAIQCVIHLEWKCNVRRADIKLNKAGKGHDNAFTT